MITIPVKPVNDNKKDTKTLRLKLERFCMVRETGLFLAASTAASVIATLTCHWHVIHSRFIQVLLPVYQIKKRPDPKGSNLF